MKRSKTGRTNPSKTGCILLIKNNLLVEAAGIGFDTRVENKQVADF
jgi:hypothetical protein